MAFFFILMCNYPILNPGKKTITAVSFTGFLFLVFSCVDFDNTMAKIPSKLEVIGHRGQAGNLPENSLAAFLGAVELGVDAIELDVVVSADKKLVVSNEPYMASDYMLDLEGHRIPHVEEQTYNLYKLD